MCVLLAQEQKAKDRAERGFASYKQQISFGIHVVVMMATFYAFGHCTAMALSKNKVHVSPKLLLRNGVVLVQLSAPFAIGAVVVIAVG